MIPAPFEYHRASSLDNAIALIHQYGDEAKIMSGGHSLLPMMKLRLATPEHIVDISGIPDLADIKEEGGKLHIGALATESDVEHSPLIKNKYHILSDVSKLIADPSVRNVATVGGNLAHGDAANDQPAVMLALRANLIAYGSKGERAIPIDEFFHGFYMTALGEDEILTAIQIPAFGKGAGSAYHKIERKVGDYAAAGVAVKIVLDDRGTCTEIGIALTNVSAVPMRAERSEEALVLQKPSDELIAKAAQMASEDCSPTDDLRGSEAYKRSLVKTYTERMIRKAIERAQASL